MSFNDEVCEYNSASVTEDFGTVSMRGLTNSKKECQTACNATYNFAQKNGTWWNFNNGDCHRDCDSKDSWSKRG
jgi:hypothetical protein